mgnify:CR=1 FL=1
MPINREDGPLKWNLNSILAVAGFTLTLLLQIVGGTVLWTNYSNKVDNLTGQVQELKVRVAEIVPLSFQVTQSISTGAENKKSIENINTRIDKVVDVLGSKVDNVLESVNLLSKNVAVLATQIERPPNQKTDFRTPTIRP